MSKMNAPKMEVVRFKEADVIVASGATRTLQKNDTLNFTGFGKDGNTNNNYVSLNSGTGIWVTPSNVDDVLNALGATGDEDIILNTTPSSLRNLFEKVDTTSTGWNDYTFEYNPDLNEGKGGFRKQ